MTIPFTGERVIPGKVARDLWNEHYARYLFAARLARNRRVLDIGCGAGYGARELARVATTVVAADVALDALIAAAAEPFEAVALTAAGAERLPFRDGSFDLVVAFEIIEHLAAWPDLIREARRVLAPGGQFVVSTPNKLVYTDHRGAEGANPFHVHEFEYGEFRDALASEFPHVAMFLQNHTEGVLIENAGRRGPVEVRREDCAVNPNTSAFFIAVCALTPQTGAPTFVYLPSEGNILREREQHIAALEKELRQKDEWLDELKREHAGLVEQFRLQTAELEERNRWAGQLNERLSEAGARFESLQQELTAEHQAAVDAYEAKIRELEDEHLRTIEWARDMESRLDARNAELGEAIRLLDDAEQRVVERTNWAISLDREKAACEQRLAMIEASRWIRLGRVFGVGPASGKP